jgi:hypothetical protein
MNKFCFGAVCAAVIGFSASAFAAECTRPTAPNVPDGNVATKEEMLSAKAAIKEYVGLTDTYIACVDNEETVAAAKETKTGPDGKIDKETQDKLNKLHATYVTLHNAAVDAETAAAAQFNAAVHAWKAKSAADAAAQPAPKK